MGCKNIIFDLGNVLISFTPEEYLSKKIAEVNKVQEVYEELFKSEEWLMLDRGVITQDEAIEILSKRSLNNGHLIKLAFESWFDILTPMEETVEILKDLKRANYNLYFLSNYHLLAFEYVREKYDFFKLFDGGVVSYEEKLLKPEEAIYKRIIEKYNLVPEESIFIDDTVVNVEGARKLNINGIVFKDSDDLRESLKTYGIKI